MPSKKSKNSNVDSSHARPTAANAIADKITIREQTNNNELRSSSIKNKNSTVTTRNTMKLFGILALYRLANAWMIRTQFDPDEYWQTLEPAYCLAFGNENEQGYYDIEMEVEAQQSERMMYGCALTWEWTRRWSPPIVDVVIAATTGENAAIDRGALNNDNMQSTTTTTTTAATKPSSQINKTIHSIIEQAMHGPVRSYVSILPTYWYYLACRHFFDWVATNNNDDNNVSNKNSNKNNDNNGDIEEINYWKIVSSYIRSKLQNLVHQNASYLISKGPSFLHAILIVAPTDLSVYLIARHLNNFNNIAMQSATTHTAIIPNGSIRSDWSKSNNNHFTWQGWKFSLPFWSLMCTLTSWFHGYALIRTYANSMETMCLLVGIALLSPVGFHIPLLCVVVAVVIVVVVVLRILMVLFHFNIGISQELFGHNNADTTTLRTNKSKSQYPSVVHRPQAKLAFILGGMSACVRFTSLAAWIPLGVIVSIRSGDGHYGDNPNDSMAQTNGRLRGHCYNYYNMLHTLFGLCAMYGLLGLFLGCCVDRWAYGFWAIPFLGNFHFNVVLGRSLCVAALFCNSIYCSAQTHLLGHLPLLLMMVNLLRQAMDPFMGHIRFYGTSMLVFLPFVE